MDGCGEIIIKQGVEVWPHELKTAEALSEAGYTITFLKRREGKGERTADVLIDGLIWEMKSPKSDKLRKVQKTLREAIHQSPYVIYDTQRVKRLHDEEIKRELEKWAKDLRSLKGLILVTKKRMVIRMK